MYNKDVTIRDQAEKIKELEGKLAEAEKFSVPWVKRMGISNVNTQLNRWSDEVGDQFLEIESLNEKLKVAVEALELIQFADGNIAPCNHAGEIEGVATEALKKIKGQE